MDWQEKEVGGRHTEIKLCTNTLKKLKRRRRISSPASHSHQRACTCPWTPGWWARGPWMWEPSATDSDAEGKPAQWDETIKDLSNDRWKEKAASLRHLFLSTKKRDAPNSGFVRVLQHTDKPHTLWLVEYSSISEFTDNIKQLNWKKSFTSYLK